jgi:hypothetical protein
VADASRVRRPGRAQRRADGGQLRRGWRPACAWPTRRSRDPTPMRRTSSGSSSATPARSASRSRSRGSPAASATAAAALTAGPGRDEGRVRVLQRLVFAFEHGAARQGRRPERGYGRRRMAVLRRCLVRDRGGDPHRRRPSRSAATGSDGMAERTADPGVSGRTPDRKHRRRSHMGELAIQVWSQPPRRTPGTRRSGHPRSRTASSLASGAGPRVLASARGPRRMKPGLLIAITTSEGAR